MFQNDSLKTYLETSSAIRSNAMIIAEWNMNIPDNVFRLGNYRYRPFDDTTKYSTLPQTFDMYDNGYYYTNATNADVIVDGIIDNNNTPILFQQTKEKEKLIYSLEDCLKHFRPSSGINKAVYFQGKYLSNQSSNFSQRPRYYMASKNDQFKYWTSYRTETTYKYIDKDGGISYGPSPTFIDIKDSNIVKNGTPFSNLEYGTASYISNSKYFISDSVPFVVYKDKIPCNKIVVKMQTNVGSVDLGTMSDGSKNFSDPLFGSINKTTPIRWQIQYLKNNEWTSAYSFNESSVRSDGTDIIGQDGVVEIYYGLIKPELYNNFILIDTISSRNLLPNNSLHGHGYLLIENTGDIGELLVWNSTIEEYDILTPTYGWQLSNNSLSSNNNLVTQITNPLSFINEMQNSIQYREFEYIRGIRIVVETMNKNNSTFDLIEMSPRLLVNLSDYVVDYSITKSIAGSSDTGLPTGNLSTSTGSINILDNDQSFNENNTNSIISKYLNSQVSYYFIENIIEDNSVYYVPIKTMFSNSIPESETETSEISIELRDFYFYFESMSAPQILLTNVSLSYAITILLDSIGFSNYSFFRIFGEQELIIPYFFVGPDQNVAEVLQELAKAAQCSMYFDENNTFIIMSKNYLMPTEDQRETNFILSADTNQNDTGIIKNNSSGNLPNIIGASFEDRKILNNGKISYTTRYIQRSYGSIRQASLVDSEKTWVYKPALLWEVSGTEYTKTINEVSSQQGSYVLGAMPLNSNLPAIPPIVENNKILYNTIDLGENIYWLTRYNGYLYSNGEVIKYDAAQFSISLPIYYGPNNEILPIKPGQEPPSGFSQGSSNVWISSNQEYQKYISMLPFNGKIYPTGLIRIYCEPYYETIDGITRIKNGIVQSHGRGQFGTTIASHTAGISDYWLSDSSARACNMQSKYLFNTSLDFEIPTTDIGVAGKDDALARQTTRSGIIKNFQASTFLSENNNNNIKSTQSGTIQSSALVMSGPSFKSTDTPLNFISYVYKQLDSKFKHFGTRMRIIGKIENNESRPQTAIGSTTYYQIPGIQPNQNINIAGGSGGLAIMLNPETNVGYYFEIIALTEANLQSYLSSGEGESPLANIIFYKIKKDQSSSDAIPIKIWSGITNILVDDGLYSGQYRFINEEDPTVYDIAVEYQNIGTIRRFYLYLNNKLIATVDDPEPLPIYNNTALFIRGSSRCMFENIYALSENYSQNTVFNVGNNVTNIFGESKIVANDSLRKYAMSGIIQQTYLSGISGQQPPTYNLYFEEFGNIMRECSYFNIRYDRAYPALYAKLSPTLNNIKGYVTSGFYADAYGAEFLIFNATDTALNLDESTGNFLRIQGITFTQDTTHELTVDEYFKKKSSFSEPELSDSVVITSAIKNKEKFNQIKLSRLSYGMNEFAIDSQYIQTDDAANDLMGWIINKTMIPKKSIGLDIFPIPTLQLGDIVKIKYSDSKNITEIIDFEKRFVIYQIEYNRSEEGPNMKIYVSEV